MEIERKTTIQQFTRRAEKTTEMRRISILELGRSWRNTNRLDHVHYSTEQYTTVQYSTLIGVESCAL